MPNQTSESNAFEQPIVTRRTNAEDKKFEAASNVDVDREGEVVNGPYVDPGSYRDPDDRVKKVRTADDDDDSNSLFVAADAPAGPGLVQPGLAQPMAGLTTPLDDDDGRDDLTPAEERERR